MLPSELKIDGNATNFKTLLEVYSVYADSNDKLSNAYGTVLDVMGAEGEALDFIGAMFGMFRITGIPSRIESSSPEADIIVERNENYEDTSFAITRLIDAFVDEADVDFRIRILRTLTARKIPTTIPELQQAIDSVVTGGKLHVYENHMGGACNVYLTGTADEDSIKNAVESIKAFLPAGVMIVIAVVSFEIWLSVREQYDTWNSLLELDLIW
jgi:hypothetical protein